MKSVDKLNLSSIKASIISVVSIPILIISTKYFYFGIHLKILSHCISLIIGDLLQRVQSYNINNHKAFGILEIY